MKRLRHFLLSMEEKTTTYPRIYEGVAIIPGGTCGNPSDKDDIQSDPTYWYGEDFAFTITQTHKLAQDKPTVTVAIPLGHLGLADDDCIPAVADDCLRTFATQIDTLNAALENRSRPNTENGHYYLDRPGGEILVRNTVYFADCPAKDYDNGSGATIYLRSTMQPVRRCLCIRLMVQLPRRKMRRTIAMLCHDLPGAVELYCAAFDRERIAAVRALAEKQAAIRAYLATSDYCAFLANGSILPRAKAGGPMVGALPFTSTPQDEITLCGVRGMGVRRGVTVITGGGYSGKSTLLDAISAGIYDHAMGDGRELCITDESAVTVAAEDGRAVRRVNISPFLRWLPGGEVADFSTDHASGSTSQAANIAEAVAGGARLLLIDEDRSATNFMIRDAMMKALIEREPITPFTDRVKELAGRGVSTILVIGGSGEYLAVADRIYRMDEFRIADLTARGRTICAAAGVEAIPPAAADWSQHRRLGGEGFSSYPRGGSREKLWVSDMGIICIGDERVDVRGLCDVACPAQLDALGLILRTLMIAHKGGDVDLDGALDALYERIAREGLDCVWTSYFTDGARFLALPRKHEVRAVVARMRGLGWMR